MTKLFLVLTLFGLNACFIWNRAATLKTVVPRPERRIELIPDIITIWIHGTTSNEFLHRFHSSPKGLTSWWDLDSKYHLKSIGKILEQYDSSNFSRYTFFTFGWSGKLDFAERRDAAKELHSAVLDAQRQYKTQYGISPRVRIVTHSHGGNVALNLSPHAANNTSFKIDELILLACPVQTATADFAESAIFGRVYSLYSSIDLTQVADPQGLYKENKRNPKLFSERRFPSTSNVVQAEIRFKQRALTHIDFITLSFAKALPGILKELKGMPAKDNGDYILKIL